MGNMTSSMSSNMSWRAEHELGQHHHGQHMQDDHSNRTVQHGRDGSTGSDDMEGRKDDADKGRDGKGMKGEKNDAKSGSSSRGNKDEFADEGETGLSLSSLFICASVAGGVLAALTMAICWRRRVCTSSCCSSSSRNKFAESFQPGQTVVVGVPIQSDADLELGMDKPTQK